MLCWVWGIILLQPIPSIVPISVTYAAMKSFDAYKDPSNPILSRKCMIMASSWVDHPLLFSVLLGIALLDFGVLQIQS